MVVQDVPDGDCDLVHDGGQSALPASSGGDVAGHGTPEASFTRMGLRSHFGDGYG
ncbi:hypothetical protein ABT237_01855 [Streptomyces sp. NPDC001581]|uniref:hypothetical protein n=1 Tax=Streptomyces sp. NPDC001581 TaxID=3154386 RepID=UPI00332B4561